MPPTSHSSSSHSSSSRSSSSHSSSSRSSSSHSSFSHSSSSHSSGSFGSSRSSGFGGGAHRSSFGSSTGSSSHSTRSGSFTTGGLMGGILGSSRSSGPSAHSRSSRTGTFNSTRSSTTAIRRPRVNQPTGYKNLVSGVLLGELMAKSHDYTYYPESWTNDEGRTYQAGYYDENGNYYKNVAIEDEETTFTCEYCGTMKKVVWKDGTAPICDRCLAPLKPDIVDKKQDVSQQQTSYNTGMNNTPEKAAKSVFSLFAKVFAALVIICIVISVAANIFMSMDESNYSGSSDYGTSADLNSTDDSIYVDEIGRTCYLDGDNYYDLDTQCWFYYNYEYDVWQYWFEGISSDYGDYGWMEYDYDEDQWYIQKSDDDWEVLPDSYDQSNLWHFS